jgi:hypothetical protein
VKLRGLVMNEEVRAAIRRVVSYAEANRVTRARLLAMMELEEAPVGDAAAHCVEVPDGYRCVFSIEEQPVGWCRHLSVSVRAPQAKGRCPVLRR